MHHCADPTGGDRASAGRSVAVSSSPLLAGPEKNLASEAAQPGWVVAELIATTHDSPSGSAAGTRKVTVTACTMVVRPVTTIDPPMTAARWRIGTGTARTAPAVDVAADAAAPLAVAVARGREAVDPISESVTDSGDIARSSAAARSLSGLGETGVPTAT
jgi:hypothetical protein